MTRLNTAVGALLVIKNERQRTDGLTEKTVLKVRVTMNDGHRCEWVKVETLHAENVLRETKEGGFTLDPRMLAIFAAHGTVTNFQ